MFALLLLATLSADPLAPGYHTHKLVVDEVERRYLVYVPKNFDRARDTPVVLAIHGASTNAREMISFCGMSAKADQAGFLLVYPQATQKVPTWNGGECCGHAAEKEVDDVGYYRALLDDLPSFAKVDRRRIFATGMSNGAIMCYRLAAELADRIAAIAPVSGTMAQAEIHPQRPVPIMHFHGSHDLWVPLSGRRGAEILPMFRCYSVDHTIAQWVQANRCESTPQIVDLPNDDNDAVTVSRATYAAQDSGAPVILYTIQGGGHTWPGIDPPLGFLLGRTTHDISANDLIWEFFQKHPLPSE